MKLSCDLHIHSVLSPCASRDNTPMNIVNMAKILGHNVIALTDHNSSLNCQAVSKLCANEGIIFIYGIEVTTSEEIHVVCLFEHFEQLQSLDRLVTDKLMKFPLNTKVYYPQLVVDSDDKEVSQIDNLLSISTDIDIYSLVDIVNKLGGVAMPAHIDKPSNSCISILGCVPVDLEVTAVEVSSHCNEEIIHSLCRIYNIITSSDAHSLDEMCNCTCLIEVNEATSRAVIDKLRSKTVN